MWIRMNFEYTLVDRGGTRVVGSRSIFIASMKVVWLIRKLPDLFKLFWASCPRRPRACAHDSAFVASHAASSDGKGSRISAGSNSGGALKS